MQRNGLLRGFAAFASWTMVSRCLGLARDVLIAASLGAGWRFDAFMIALRIPNMLRRMTAEGALTAAFVPVFTQELAQSGAEAAKIFFGRVVLCLSVLLGLVSVCVVLKPGLIVSVFAPGLDVGSAVYSLATELIRITFPYIVFISVTALFGGVLVANGRFAAFAATSSLFNICIIIAALVALWLNLDVAPALAWGVAISGLFQLAFVLFAALRCNMGPLFRFRGHGTSLRVFFLALGPALLGASVGEINSIIDLMIASTLEAGSISVLFLSERVSQLPLGLIGASLGLAILPLLSRKISQGDKKGAKQVLRDGLLFSQFISLPAACSLMVLALPIVQILFEHGNFNSEDSLRTALALQILATSLPAAVANKCFLACFYAHKDTSRPAKVAVFALFVNASVSYILSLYYGYIGVAIGTSLSLWFQSLMFVWWLVRLDRMDMSSHFIRSLLIAGCVSAVMAGALVVMSIWLPVEGGFLPTIGKLSIHIVVGFGVYMLFAYNLGFLSLLKRMSKMSII